MDKLLGTVSPVSTDKKIASIQVKVKIGPSGLFKVSDIQLQESGSQTQYSLPVFEQFKDEPGEMHFNFLARGNTTLIAPYMSIIPYDSNGEVLPGETDYITTPVKADLFIHKEFSKSKEKLSIGPGLTGQSKRFELNENVSSYTHCIYDGYTSQKYIGGVETQSAFIGRELRLANADSKFTMLQDKRRKTTGALYANKTRKGV